MQHIVNFLCVICVLYCMCVCGARRGIAISCFPKLLTPLLKQILCCHTDCFSHASLDEHINKMNKPFHTQCHVRMGGWLGSIGSGIPTYAWVYTKMIKTRFYILHAQGHSCWEMLAPNQIWTNHATCLSCSIGCTKHINTPRTEQVCSVHLYLNNSWRPGNHFLQFWLRSAPISFLSVSVIQV